MNWAPRPALVAWSGNAEHAIGTDEKYFYQDVKSIEMAINPSPRHLIGELSIHLANYFYEECMKVIRETIEIHKRGELAYRPPVPWTILRKSINALANPHNIERLATFYRRKLRFAAAAVKEVGPEYEFDRI
jgi:hypothetical protein